MERKENIIFIGLPGSGKSVMSNELSIIYGKKVLDLDNLLIQEIGSLQDYIDNHGNIEFKKKEYEICNKYISTAKDCIISPGGSIIFYDCLMEYIKRKFIIIFLDVDLDVILKRTNNFYNRGVILPDEGYDMQYKFRKLYEIRTELCKKYCDIHIKGNNIKINEVVRNVMEYYSRQLVYN